MAMKVLSIEIGQGLTRVVEMDYKAKNPKIYNCFTFETPQNVVQDGMVTKSDIFASSIKSECKKRKIKTNRVVFSVTSSRITNRDVKIPKVKEKQIPDVINANAADFFPVDLTQYRLVYDAKSAVPTSDGKQLTLNLLAVPNDITKSYYDFAASCDFILQALDFVGNSVYQVVKDSFETGTHAILKIDEKTSLLTIISEGKSILQRSIGYGVDDAIEVVRRNRAFGTNLTYGGAIDVLCGKTCIRRYLNVDNDYREEEDTDKSIAEARIEVTDSLRYLIGNINRNLEYFLSRNHELKIESVALLGLGADFSGLSKLMSNELNLKVRVFQNMKEVKYVLGNEDFQVNLSRYAACIGAGKAPMSLIPEPGKGVSVHTANDKRLNANATPKTSNRAIVGGVMVLLLGIAIAIFLAATAVAGYTKVNLQKKQLEDSIAQLEAEGIEAIYREYTTVAGLVNSLDAIYDTTRSRNEDLVEFIEELERKMPASLLVINFTATSQGVTMSIETDSKESAAKTLMQLRTFESIEIVNSTGLTDNLEEVAERVVSFTVDCVYKPVALEEEE